MTYPFRITGRTGGVVHDGRFVQAEVTTFKSPVLIADQLVIRPTRNRPTYCKCCFKCAQMGLKLGCLCCRRDHGSSARMIHTVGNVLFCEHGDTGYGYCTQFETSGQTDLPLGNTGQHDDDAITLADILFNKPVGNLI